MTNHTKDYSTSLQYVSLWGTPPLPFELEDLKNKEEKAKLECVPKESVETCLK